MAIEITDTSPDPKLSNSTTSVWHSKFSGSRSKVSVAERILFTERLSLLLETGVPLHNALQSLYQQTEQPGLRSVIQDITNEVLEGHRFSEALARHVTVFPASYVNLVAASEGGGFLPAVLQQLTEMDEKQEKLKAAVISSFTYPAVLAVFSIGVVIFILVVVFPKFATLFTSIQSQLPITTVILMKTSDLLLNRPAVVIGVAGGVTALLLIALSRPGTTLLIDRLKLRLPFFRDLYIRIYLIRLLRVMGISLEHGVTILATLTACRQVVSNTEFQKFILRLEQQVTEGQGIATGFQSASYIPPTVQQMIETGEQTGTLGRVMSRVANHYDRELTRHLAQLSKMAEPIMLLVMGALVGVIVSSIILPIFKLSLAVH